MTNRRLLPVLAAMATLGVLPATAQAAPADQAAARAAASSTTVTTRNVGGFGRILVDSRGRPLYIFTRDRGRSSRCYGACAKAWPVVRAKGKLRARGGAKTSRVGRTKRRGGVRQLTYRGRPVYRYVDDRPGVALCHNVREFGGLWLLVRASGKRV